MKVTKGISKVAAVVLLSALSAGGAEELLQPPVGQGDSETVGVLESRLSEMRGDVEDVIAFAKRLGANLTTESTKSIPKLSRRIERVEQRFQRLIKRRDRSRSSEGESESKGGATGVLEAAAVESAYADFLKRVSHPYLTVSGDTERFNGMRKKMLSLRKRAANEIRPLLVRQLEAQEDGWRNWLEDGPRHWYYSDFYDRVGSSHPEWENLVELRMEYAYQLQELRKMDEAAQQWRAVLEWQPNRTDAWERLSYHGFHMGKVERSLKMLDIAAALEKRRPLKEQNPWIWHNFADFVLLFRNDVRKLSKSEFERFGGKIPRVPTVWEPPFKIDAALEKTRVFSKSLKGDLAIVERALGFYERAKLAAVANPEYGAHTFYSAYADGLKHLYLFSRVWPAASRPKDRGAVLTRLNRALFDELRVALEAKKPKWECDGVRVDLAKFLIEAGRWKEADWHLDRVTTVKYDGRASEYRQQIKQHESATEKE